MSKIITAKLRKLYQDEQMNAQRRISLAKNKNILIIKLKVRKI